MNKKGFTLIELLAVIAILAVLSLITVPMVIGVIEDANKKAFMIGAQNVLDSAKQYVIGTESFYKDNISIEELKSSLDNYNYIGGVILIDEDDNYSVDGLTDGKYCAIGTKTNMRVAKGDCSQLDDTPPEAEVYLNKRTSDSITILVDAKDETSGIYGFSYSTDGINYSEIIKENIYTINGLNKNETVKIYVKVYNNIYDGTNSEDNLKLSMTEKIVEFTTSNIEKPRFEVSTGSGSANAVKIVNIIYPTNDNGYEYSYEIDGEKYIITEEKVTLTITSNCIIKATIKTPDEVIENELRLAGFDNEGPEFDIVYNQTWETTKKIKIEVAYEQTGLPEEPYSYDGGITWTSSNEKIYTSGEVVTNTIKVRDILGNISTKFTINGEEQEKLVIDYVDNEKPNCTLKVISGTLGSNGWYTSDVVVDFDELYDVAKYCDNGVCENKQPGSGIKSSTIDKTQIQNNGTTVVTGTVVDNVDNTYTCTIEVKKDTTTPSISANNSSVDLTYGQNSSLTDLFTSENNGESSGSTTCYLIVNNQRNKVITNNSELPLGINTIECITTTGAGNSASAKTTVKHSYSGTPSCSSGTYQNGTCYFASNASVCGTTQVPTTKQEYSTCATTKNTCAYGCDSVWNPNINCTTTQGSCNTYQCTLYKSCEKCFDYATSSSCPNGYTDKGVSGGSRKCCKTGRQNGCGTETVTGSACNNANSKVCISYNTSTSCAGGYESKNCSNCKTGSPNECQAGYVTVNTTETVANSCNKSEYIKYSCPTNGTNSNTGATITATLTNNICKF